ncbi:hypothetical protein KIW84_062312 [Lathyrus oleraceus]|uniref:non-specific serine/threonine protein kinase n=1 Tax=Pisum sativum TaxID=3888 RepID=A0A9D5A698_PEA|nr:hypothetical protein KIW84_062312 [Pisum sativum]
MRATPRLDSLGSTFVLREFKLLKLYASFLKGGTNLLVFEYMPNGAKRICYSHHDCSPYVIHSSILLDEDYEAEIAEFGVARFAEKSQMGYSIFAGTHAYIAPGMF